MVEAAFDDLGKLETVLAQRDALVDALRTLDTLLDFGDTLSDNIWTFEDLTGIQAAFDKAKAALDQVTSDVGGSRE